MAHTSPTFDLVFLTLQACVVAFLLLHDFVPLGRLNNLAAIRSQDSLTHQILVTLIPGIPTALGLYFSAQHIGRPYPHGLMMLLWINYGTLFIGMLQAWWIPYLLVPDPVRAARYQIIFRGTHTFLPQRNGLAPDTLHTLFHIVFVFTFLMLLVRTIR
jgi:ABC-type xylose transport system permease subunit